MSNIFIWKEEPKYLHAKMTWMNADAHLRGRMAVLGQPYDLRLVATSKKSISLFISLCISLFILILICILILILICILILILISKSISLYILISKSISFCISFYKLISNYTFSIEFVNGGPGPPYLSSFKMIQLRNKLISIHAINP